MARFAEVRLALLARIAGNGATIIALVVNKGITVAFTSGLTDANRLGQTSATQQILLSRCLLSFHGDFTIFKSTEEEGCAGMALEYGTLLNCVGLEVGVSTSQELLRAVQILLFTASYGQSDSLLLQCLHLGQ